MFNITDAVPVQENTGFKKRGESRYPFANLTVGKAFFVPADQKASFQTIRSAAYRFGKMYGRVFQCNILPDGRLQVRCTADDGSVPVVEGKLVLPAAPPKPADNESNPTYEQFRGSLAAMAPGQAFVCGEAYAARFEQFKAWTEAAAEELNAKFSALEIKIGELTITRLPPGVEVIAEAIEVGE